MQFLRVGTSGMRGKLAHGLSPDVAMRYLAAIGSYMQNEKIVITRDSRVSSNMFYNLALSALISSGCEVVELELGCAPELSYAILSEGAKGGVLISAGHHRAGWNAITPFNSDGSYFNSVQTQELLDIYHSNEFVNSTWDQIGSVALTDNKIITNYVQKLLSTVNIDAIKQKSYKVVLDFCNGPGSLIADYMKSACNLDLVIINRCKSGHLPHDPEPRPRNASQVKTLVDALDADIGFVFSSDMSRLSVVTASGNCLSEEATFPLVLKYFFNCNNYNGKVVSTFCSSRMVDDIVEASDAQLAKVATGQSYVIDKMIETGAEIGGEGSGSVAIKENLLSYDGFHSFLKIVEAMATTNKTIDQLVGELPVYHIVKKKISCHPGQGYSIVRNAHSFFPDAHFSEDDGARFDWEDGWLHLRPSKTEPILRMIVEHKSKEKAEDLSLQVRGLIERLAAL